MKTSITRAELKKLEEVGMVKYHHTSLFMGYVRRTGEPSKAMPYKGRFGEGFVTHQPNYRSTRYSYITYYVFTSQEV